MFVGCVVAGSVMLACKGAKVRGALIRDVAAYAIAVLSVALILWSGKVQCTFPVYIGSDQSDFGVHHELLLNHTSPCSLL